jgi:hypothetical protein
MRLDRRARVQAVGEGGNDAHPLGLERGDDAVVVGGVSGQHVGAQHQQADGADGVPRGGKRVGARGHPARETRVIDADLGIFSRQRRLERAAQRPAVAVGVAVHQEADHGHDVLFRTGQPVLQREEVGADILGGARDEGQQLGEAAQHGHLLFAARGPRLGRAAQLLQHGHRTLGRAVHAVGAHAGQLDDLARRHRPDHRVAVGRAGRQRGQDRLDVVLHEQHGGEDDVAPPDVLDAGGEGDGVAAPVGGGVQADRQPGRGGGQGRLRFLHGPRKVVVQRDDDHAHFGRPWRRARRLSG